MVKGGYFSVSYSSEFRPPILAYLGSNVYLVYNFLHPASQRGEISFPCISTYMSLWCCGPLCTSGEFQGNVYLLHSISLLKLVIKLKDKLQNASLKVFYPRTTPDADHIIKALCIDCFLLIILLTMQICKLNLCVNFFLLPTRIQLMLKEFC